LSNGCPIDKFSLTIPPDNKNRRLAANGMSELSGCRPVHLERTSCILIIAKTYLCFYSLLADFQNLESFLAFGRVDGHFVADFLAD
jgi:hypothetical protein